MDFKVSSFTHNQMGSSTPRECRSAGWDGKCDFSNTRSCQSLIRFSEDTKNLTLLYHVYTKCSSAVCKPFGPWCQKLTLKKAKHMSSTFTHSSTSRAGKESSSPTKDRPDRTAPPGVTKYPAKDKNGSPKDTTNIQKDKTAKNSDPSDKTTKSGDVFDRLAGSSSYVFCHSDDVRSHIADYRERHTVGRTGRKSRRVAVLGVDFPDPYAVKRKKPCVCTEYPTLNSTPTESTTPGGASTQDPCDVNKTPWPGERAARAVPNLAPVRQHNHTSSGDVSSVADKSVVKVRTKSDASPPLLILPSIRKGDDPRSLALTGQTPPRYTTPPDRGAVQGRPSSVNNTDRDDQCVSDVTCDNGKTRPVKLKYTNRCAPHTLQEVTQEDKQTGRGKDVQPVRVVHTRPVADDNAKLTRDCRETRRDDDVRHPGSAPVTDQQTAPPVGHVIVGPTRATHRMITGTATSPDMAKVTASVRDNQDSRVSVTASLNEGLWQLKRDQHKQHVRQGERESRLVSVRVMSVDDLPSLVRTQQFKSPARRTQLFRHQDLPPPPLNMAVYGDRTLEGGEGKENQQLVSLWNTGVAATQLGGVVSLYPQSGDGAVGTDDVTSTTNKAERLRYMYRGNGVTGD
nr:hypothetical protein BaRGS_035298 [Batillaria attramentaria]